MPQSVSHNRGSGRGVVEEWSHSDPLVYRSISNTCQHVVIAVVNLGDTMFIIVRFFPNRRFFDRSITV